MFSSSRSRHPSDSFLKHRAGKASVRMKAGSFGDATRSRRVHQQQLQLQQTSSPMSTSTVTPAVSPNLTSAIITICVGPQHRLFAAHEDVLCHSPFFQSACRDRFFQPNGKRINLPDEEPEVFSCVLEYLYKGDYSPRLQYDKRMQAWHLEQAENGANVGATVWHNASGGAILKDTAIYCTADKYGLEELKKLALRKQGLQSGIQCSTILISARYAYANTPDADSKLRAHYLALIIRSRHTFKRSGTMQTEMEHGGKMFFDLFVAMVNHMDDIADMVKSPH